MTDTFPPLPRMIPVLDLRAGIVVHAIAGERENYHPLQSLLVAGSDPLQVAEAIQSHCHSHLLYVADLDGILHQTPDWITIERLAATGLLLAVDAGVRTCEDRDRLLDLGVTRVILPLETCSSPATIRQLLRGIDPSRLVFSLDLRHGRPMTPLTSEWETDSPQKIARQVIEVGLRSVLVLDIAAVGRGNGLPTLGLCQELREREPQLEIWTGGGVRSQDDFTQASMAGVDSLLVASALHDGRLPPTVGRQTSPASLPTQCGM